MKKVLLVFVLVFSNTILFAKQNTFSVNSSFETRSGIYAITHATIVVNANQTLSNATLLIKGSTIQAVGAELAVAKGYVVIDLKGNFIYPSLVDAFTS